jgi:hypothetical protein
MLEQYLNQAKAISFHILSNPSFTIMQFNLTVHLLTELLNPTPQNRMFLKVYRQYEHIKIIMFWVVMPCSSQRAQHFEETYHLSLQGWGVGQARNQQAKSSDYQLQKT